MPDAIGPLTDSEHDELIYEVTGHGHEFRLVATEPGIAAIEAAAEVAAVVVEDDISAIGAARELGRGNLNRGGLIARDPRIRDGDSSKHGGCETAGHGNGVHVTRLEADFVWNPRVVGDDEGERAGCSSSGRDDRDG